MSNGIGKNPLNDISKVYLHQIANEGTMDIKGFAIPKSEQDAAKKRVMDKTKKKQMEKGISSAGYTKEGLDPVGKEDSDVNNDGKKDSTDKYLMKRRKAIAGAMKKRMSEGVRDMDPEKGTAERKARLEKKRGMKMDDHPQYKKEEVEVDEAMSSYDRNRKRAAQRAADRNAARAAGKTGVVPGVGYVSPRKEKESYVDSAGTTRHKSGAKMEEVEAEGYEPMTPERKLRVDRAKKGAYDKDMMAQSKGDKKEADKQFKRRMAMDSRTKMKKESFSNWRTDLSEVMTDEIDSKPVKEKKINNKIKINPKLGEAVEALGGEILEVTEVDEAVYGGAPAKKEEPKDNRMMVTNADKKGNTPAYQKMKAGDKRYKAADHMKESSFKKVQEKLNLKKTQWGV